MVALAFAARSEGGAPAWTGARLPWCRVERRETVMASNILEAQAAAAQMGAALATPTASDITAGILHVERPEANAIKVLDLTSAKELVFDFDLAACKVAVLDVDVV